MNVYEGMFLLNSVEARRDWDAAKAQVQDILTKSGAEIATNYRWDERRLAYEIKGQKRGTYYLVYFKAESDAIATIRRDCRMNDLVLRQLILRWEKEIPPLPSEEKEDGEEKTPKEKEKKTETKAAEEKPKDEAKPDAGKDEDQGAGKDEGEDKSESKDASEGESEGKGEAGEGDAS